MTAAEPRLELQFPGKVEAPMISLILMALVASAQAPGASAQPSAAPASVAASPAPAAESWRFYGGDYITWSALDTLSVRREGDVAHTRQAVWGQRGPLEVAGRAFDYVITEVDYDCAAGTNWGVRAHYYDRGGSLLWSAEINSRPRSTANSSPFSHFRAFICGEGAPAADPAGAPSLRALFERNRSWLVAPAR